MRRFVALIVVPFLVSCGHETQVAESKTESKKQARESSDELGPNTYKCKLSFIDSDGKEFTRWVSREGFRTKTRVSFSSMDDKPLHDPNGPMSFTFEELGSSGGADHYKLTMVWPTHSEEHAAEYRGSEVTLAKGEYGEFLIRPLSGD